MELADSYLLDERLRIKRRLGEGGFGAVYEARDEHLHRTVAVKVLKDSVLHDPSVRKRFLREGKILAQVQSEYLVRLFSINISSKGFLYMVMELAEGTTLRSELNEHDRLSESDTLQVARGIALGLKALSSYGVVHRDLKPDNIMLMRTANDITIKVLDFGLSGLINKADVKDTYVTASGAILGSVHYIAPEACMGEKATFQSDCYALGCVIYECLVGTPPFMANDPAAVVFKHVSETPIDPVESCPKLGKGIRQLLTQLLQKDPSLRFESADDLLAAIDLCIDGEVPTIKSGGALLVAPAAARLSSRLKMLVVVGGILVFCGSIAGYFYVRQQQQNRIPEINAAEIGGNQILKLCDQIRAVKPDGSLSYQQCTQLLKRLLLAKNVPAATINDLRGQIRACDERLTALSATLIKEVDHKANGLSPNQFDAIFKTGAKLKLIGHTNQSRAIFGAALSCLARSLEERNADQTKAQLTLLVDVYLRDGALQRSVLEQLADRMPSFSDMGLNLRLAHAFRETECAAPQALRARIAAQLDAARAEVLGANGGLLVQQIQDAVAEKNCDAAKHYAFSNLRGLKATKSPGDSAPQCFAMGCLLSECDTAAGAEFFKRAMLFCEQGHRVDDLYLNSMNNYARYLNDDGQFDKARPLIWKIHDVIVSGASFLDQPKVGWMQVALGLPRRSDHLKTKDAIEGLLRGDSAYGVKELKWRTEALKAYGRVLDSLGLHRGASRVLAPSYETAKKGNVRAVGPGG
ncbi:MAG: serine/threonine protein kinase [Candidatus Obscuribacterales bacterium]|nr:serine/threonine protein kinase [Candidatus Obscuribacterales bacterium]